MKNLLKTIVPAAALALAAFTTSCDDSKTYAELLTDETHYVNNFLADQHVINYVPDDSVFIVGKNAPYYRLDEEGNLYMQIEELGPEVMENNQGGRAKYNDLIYFRFTRYNLSNYVNGTFSSSEGNDQVLGGNYSFRYGNYELSSSYSYGSGIQAPLQFVPVGSKVNIVVKSQYGMPSEMSYVIPFLYSIRYYRPMI